MTPLGAASFCVISGLIRDQLGTKITILMFSLPCLVGWSLLIFAINPMMVRKLFVTSDEFSQHPLKFLAHCRKIFYRSRKWSLRFQSAGFCWRNCFEGDSRNSVDPSSGFCQIWRRFHVHTRIDGRFEDS